MTAHTESIRSQGDPPEPLIENPQRLWLLEDGLSFLNHGSFGAVPREVLEAQDDWRARIERDPVEMISRRMSELLEVSRWAVGEFIHCDPDAIGFLTNATSAINAVVRSMHFKPGDRIVAPDHVYNAVRQTLRWVARRDGAEYVEFPVELPITDEQQLGDRVLESIPDNTRLLLIDQISSPTALCYPLERIIAECRDRSIQVVVDGAHAPGMVDVDVSELDRLGALAWCGNLHKWGFAPKGCAVLHVHEEHRNDIHPPTISHFLDEGFLREFEWQGTCDFTPWLSAPTSLEFAERTFGWDRLRAHNHALATWAHAYLCDRWESRPLTPLDGSLLGSMASVVIPRAVQGRFESTDRLEETLHDEFRVEVPTHSWGDEWMIRVSAQAYNRPEDYHRLADAILQLADRGPSVTPRKRGSRV